MGSYDYGIAPLGDFCGGCLRVAPVVMLGLLVVGLGLGSVLVGLVLGLVLFGCQAGHATAVCRP